MGWLGLFYVGANLIDPSQNKDDYEEFVDNANTAMGDIPLTFTSEFTLVDHDGNALGTSDGHTLGGREKVSFSISKVNWDVHLHATRDMKVEYRKG